MYRMHLRSSVKSAVQDDEVRPSRFSNRCRPIRDFPDLGGVAQRFDDLDAVDFRDRA